MHGLVDQHKSFARLALFGKLIAALWLLAAIANIRATVPLWSDEVRLWQWALRQNPGSIVAGENLFSAYLERNNLAVAGPLVEELMASKRACPNCMVNVAQYAIDRGDASLADAALDRAKSALENVKAPRRLTVMYLVATAGVHRLRHEWIPAEEAYRAAIAVDPLDPNPHMNLAILLAKRGRPDAARQAADAAIALYPPREREARRGEFETALAASARLTPDAASPEPDR
jgi:tetratricopeptide (TPR) repeat protein